MKITIFDQISAIGGTLGLFTGVSLITFAEIFYWSCRFFLVGARGAGNEKGGFFSKKGKTTPGLSYVDPIRSQYSIDYGYRVPHTTE